MAFQNALLARLATVHLATKYTDRAVHKAPDFLLPAYDRDKLNEKLRRDSRFLSAMVLDPASFVHVMRRVPLGWDGDVTAFLYKEILVPAATFKGLAGPQAEAAAKTKAELKTRLAAILGQPAPALMDPDVWKQHLAEEAAKERKKFEVRDDEDMGAEAGGGGENDPFVPLLEQLRAEMDSHRRMLMDEFSKHMKDNTYVPFGKELEEGPDARYEYWPSVQMRYPLLYFCAATLLGGDGNSTCFNERMHSPAGRITEKYRASMLPDSVERLTLGYFFVRREFLAKKEEEKQRLLKLSEEAREKLEQEVALQELKAESAGDVDVEEVV